MRDVLFFQGQLPDTSILHRNLGCLLYLSTNQKAASMGFEGSHRCSTPPCRSLRASVLLGAQSIPHRLPLHPLPFLPPLQSGAPVLYRYGVKMPPDFFSLLVHISLATHIQIGLDGTGLFGFVCSLRTLPCGAAGYASPLEHLFLCVVMGVPILGACSLGTASAGLVYGYVLLFDFLRCMGHSNVEVLPQGLFELLPFLRYLIYTPT